MIHFFHQCLQLSLKVGNNFIRNNTGNIVLAPFKSSVSSVDFQVALSEADSEDEFQNLREVKMKLDRAFSLHIK